MYKKLWELATDKEFRDMIPPLTREERERLAENIERDGCRDALVVWDGVIVDGHNRYAICHEKGIPFSVEEKAFEDRDAAIEWIIRNQLGRRNLQLYQRVVLVERYRSLYEDQARENSLGNLRGGSNPPDGVFRPHREPHGRTNARLAELSGLSEPTIKRGRRVLKSATDEEKKELSEGTKTVTGVYHDIMAREKEPKPEPAKPRPAKKLSAFDQRSQEIADSFRKFEGRTRSDIDLEHLTGDIEVYTSGIASYLQGINFAETATESRACAREVIEKHKKVVDHLQGLLQEVVIDEAIQQ